jgi:hypothetical protein
LDTSYIVRAWTLWYPRVVFPGYWQVLLSAIRSHEVIIIDVVRDELTLQIGDFVALVDAQVQDWAVATKQKALDAAMTQLEQELVSGRVIRSYPTPNVMKYMQVADPRLVLHAQLNRHVVVSNEITNRLDKKGPKIPDLCAHFVVQHADPAQFADALGYSFVAGPR